MNEKKLGQKAKRQNKKALLQLVMQQKDDYYRLAYSYMKNSHDSMDVMEEMIIILYEKIGQLKNLESFYSWSKTILVNICKGKLKKQQKELLVDDMEFHSNTNQTTNPYKYTAESIDIEQLLKLLNPHQAEAIKLKYLHDLDYATIAKITNVSVGTVKSRIHNGLNLIKRVYGRKEE
ncbi:MAG: RNA polymerase sigma factor [Bacillus sp. (in: Bacteria)]|uniref:RNA polymerase sigma factor n=1 Tax=Niallia sp. FSL W8-1348 TaxID=2954656 RepID=UPI0030F82F56|nr:RNA polymerase sigma factor [Bacillus sp. (in: firmicutes)]